MKLNYFNFKSLGKQVLLTNDFGDYMFVEEEEFGNLVKQKVGKGSLLEKRLLEHRMIYEETELSFSNINRYDLRVVKNHLNMSASLHIFVVTTACNMGCVYCQANNGTNCSNLFMNKEMAEKAVNIALQSPAKHLTFEFQGGEPLLNFKIIKYIVEYTEEHKGYHLVNYNVVSNLTLLNSEMIEFFKEFRVGVSTSIDGNEQLHNYNRPYKDGTSTFKDVISSLNKLRKAGIYVGAIQTTTKESLKYPREIVETYCNLGFDSIFIRPLTPLGKATVNWQEIGYSAEEFLHFYIKALDVAIQINKRGVFFKEEHAAILLKRISGYFVNYMELRSPCGAGIGQLAYYADGNIFTCDEGRMLHEMGDSSFCLGNVMESTYQSIIKTGTCRAVCESSMLETLPSCCDCVYQPYCGTCPVVSFASNGDILEKTPYGYRCKIYSGILDKLFTMFQENDDIIMQILHSWSN
ncbi:His-Xaa-Ser system radical SAM maturase HxsB [Sporofaciens sp. SGI.106]|uniref:His-Xaa-Ser system radical SAM maturase HxsB n=1 Tax=Sporofaciens sp. SGI.106 TaxID=3420568 RepID=UPI003D054545